jgi:hypothetical protein
MANLNKREKMKESAIQLSTRNGWKSEASSVHVWILFLKKRGRQISTVYLRGEKYSWSGDNSGRDG